MTDLTIVRAPRSSANDDVLSVLTLTAADGQGVAAGQPLLEVEGAKAVTEVEAEAAGVVHFLVAPGDKVPVGGPLAVVAPPGMGREEVLAAVRAEARPEAAPAAEGVRFSRKAAALIAEHGLDAALFAGRGLVDEAAVRAHLADAGAAPADWAPSQPRRGHQGRVLVIGARPGAWQVLSVLLFEQGTRVVGLLDDDAARHGTKVMGVPVLGPLAMMDELARDGTAQSVICAVSSSIPFRRQVRDLARAAGLGLANAIHPTACFDDGARIGGGNYFGAFCYVGAETVIGDNGFFSSRTTFEHHNVVGCDVTTGPNVATSGLVRIGDGVKFGAGVVVEPRVAIGDGAVLASQTAITADVPPGAVVKSGLAAKVRG